MNRPQWLNIPEEVAEREDLFPVAKLVFGYLNAYHQTTGTAFPSVARIARDCGTSRKGVQNALAQLTEAHLIERQERRRADGGATSHLFINRWLLEKATRTQAEPEPPGGGVMITQGGCNHYAGGGVMITPYKNTLLKEGTGVQGGTPETDPGEVSTNPATSPNSGHHATIPPQDTPTPPPGDTPRLPTAQDFHFLADAHLRPPAPDYDEEALTAQVQAIAKKHHFGNGNVPDEYRRAVKLLHRQRAIALSPADILGVFEQWAQERSLRRVKTLVTGTTRDGGVPYWRIYLGYHKDQQPHEQGQRTATPRGHRNRRDGQPGGTKKFREGVDAYLAQRQARRAAGSGAK